MSTPTPIPASPGFKQAFTEIVITATDSDDKSLDDTGKIKLLTQIMPLGLELCTPGIELPPDLFDGISNNGRAALAGLFLGVLLQTISEE